MRTVAVILSFLVTQAAIAQTEAIPMEMVESPSPRLWARIDMLSWTPHMRGLDYAASETGGSLVLGTGRSHEVQYDRDTGMRTQLGIFLGAGWVVDFGYTHFGSEGVDRAVRPAGTGQLFSTFSHPGGPEEADVIDALTTLDYNVFDLSARHGVVKGNSLGLDVFAGFRWADIQQDIRVDLEGRDFVGGLITNAADINAFGLRSGVDGRWFVNSRWSGFANTSFAALYGQFDHHRFESNISGTQVQVDFRDTYVQPIFNIETALGLSYSYGTWRVTGGYELSVWTNLADSLRFVDDIEEGSLAAMPGDLLLEGFFFRLEKTF